PGCCKATTTVLRRRRRPSLASARDVDTLAASYLLAPLASLENWNGDPKPPRSRQVRGKPKNSALISSEKTIPYCAASPRMNLCSLESPALTPLQIGRASCRERLQLSGAGGPVNKKATTSTT